MVSFMYSSFNSAVNKTNQFIFKMNNPQLQSKVKIKDLLKLPEIDATVSDFTLNSNNGYITFKSELMRGIRKQKDHINIFIDTHGGYINIAFDIIDIFNMYRMNTNGKVNCYYTGAHSAGFTILQACDRRIAFKGSILGIHKARGLSKYGNAVTDLQRSDIEVKRIKITKKQLFLLRTNKMKYFNTKQALEYGFIDGVLK